MNAVYNRKAQEKALRQAIKDWQGKRVKATTSIYELATEILKKEGLVILVDEYTPDSSDKRHPDLDRLDKLNEVYFRPDEPWSVYLREGAPKVSVVSNIPRGAKEFSLFNYGNLFDHYREAKPSEDVEEALKWLKKGGLVL